MQIIIGIILMVVGGLIVVKSESFLKIFGRIAFFEKHLGPEGGSRLGYKIIGLIVFFLGLLSFTGMIGGFIQWLFSPVINAGPGK